MLEQYWFQRAKVSWALFGDKNSKFFHATMVPRKRRNEIRAVKGPQGDWITEEGDICRAFMEHFKGIYKGTQTRPIRSVYSQDMLQQLLQISSPMQIILWALPSQREIQTALFVIGPCKAAGLDGFGAKTVQENWGSFGPVITKTVLEFFEFSSCKIKPSVNPQNTGSYDGDVVPTHIGL